MAETPLPELSQNLPIRQQIRSDARPELTSHHQYPSTFQNTTTMSSDHRHSRSMSSVVESTTGDFLSINQQPIIGNQLPPFVPQTFIGRGMLHAEFSSIPLLILTQTTFYPNLATIYRTSRSRPLPSDFGGVVAWGRHRLP